MTDGWGFLAYYPLFLTIIVGILCFLLLAFFIKFQSFRDFLASYYFWLAWLLPYYLFFILAYMKGVLWDLRLYIVAIPLPLIYFLRKLIIANRIRRNSKFLILWIIPVSICSFFIHWGFLAYIDLRMIMLE